MTTTWFDLQPLSLGPWMPVGDDSTHAPAHPPQTTLTFSPPLALAAKDYAGAIDAILRSARVGLENAAHMTYTQEPARWGWHSPLRKSFLGQYPLDADCSAFVSWCYEDGTEFLHPADFLNGDSWLGGYTTTLAAHGEAVLLADTVPCDVVLYGGSEWLPQHAAITVGARRVVSFGGQGGPDLLPIEFGMPVVGVRRYLKVKP